MAFDNFEILKKLLLLLDDYRNDIYLHIDKKSNDFYQEDYQGLLQHSKLHFITRKAVYWADFSQVEVTLDLIKNSIPEGYKYYHLLSGVDLPIKTQDEIHAFFYDRTEEFLGIVPKEVEYSVKRLKYYYFCVNTKFYRKCKCIKVLSRGGALLQALCGVNRLKNCNMKILDGWQWFSITDDFARYIIAHESLIYKMFSRTIAPDELFIHILAFNSRFKEKIFDMTDLQKGSLRFIDWKRGKPYVFKKEDFDDLINSSCLFARKFDAKVDMNIVNMIFENQKNR